MSKISHYQKNLTDFFEFSDVNYSDLSVDLLKKSKKLILNTKKYSDYSNYYNRLTMKYTFKLPGITHYPIQMNEDIIPINNYKKNKINIRKLLIRNSQLSTSLEKNSDDHPKKMKTIYNNIFLNKSDNSINANGFLKYIDAFNNMDDAVHKYVTYKEKYFVDKNKDGNKKLLKEYIEKEKSNQNEISFDKEIIYKKENIFTIKDIEVKLRCDTVMILFTDEDNNKISKIKFPFKYIPLFYGINFNSLKLFFFSVIDYDINSNKFILNKEKFINVYKEYLNNSRFYNIDCILLNHSQMSYLKYDWIIYNEKTIKKFKFKIYMPKIKVRFKYLNGYKTSLIKSLDSTHLSYLLLEKFKDWDLFLVDSFCLIKEFRKTINQVLSYSPTINNKNIKLNLDKTKIKLYRKKLNKNSLSFFISFFNDNDLNGKNVLFDIKTPKIQINYKDTDIEPYEKIYNLNLKESIQLNKMKRSFWPEDIVNKCLKIKEGKSIYFKKKIETKLELDKNIFDFDSDLFKYIKRQKEFLNMIQNSKKLKINLYFPKIYWYINVFENNSFIEKIYLMNREEFEELFEKPMKEWYKFIINNINKIKSSSKSAKNLNDQKYPNYLYSSKDISKIRKGSVRHSVKVFSSTPLLNQDNA